MNLELIFAICSQVATAGWLLLVFGYRWRYSRPIIFSGIILLFAIIYSVLIANSLGKSDGGGFGSLEQVAKLFDNRMALLAGWIHYLAFDLLVGGCWISADARRHGIPHLAVIPCLFFTFMLGPLGYLLYRVVRLFKKQTFLIDTYENPA